MLLEFFEAHPQLRQAHLYGYFARCRWFAELVCGAPIFVVVQLFCRVGGNSSGGADQRGAPIVPGGSDATGCWSACNCCWRFLPVYAACRGWRFAARRDWVKERWRLAATSDDDIAGSQWAFWLRGTWNGSPTRPTLSLSLSLWRQSDRVAYLIATMVAALIVRVVLDAAGTDDARFRRDDAGLAGLQFVQAWPVDAAREQPPRPAYRGGHPEVLRGRRPPRSVLSPDCGGQVVSFGRRGRTALPCRLMPGIAGSWRGGRCTWPPRRSMRPRRRQDGVAFDIRATRAGLRETRGGGGLCRVFGDDGITASEEPLLPRWRRPVRPRRFISPAAYLGGRHAAGSAGPSLASTPKVGEGRSSPAACRLRHRDA